MTTTTTTSTTGTITDTTTYDYRDEVFQALRQWIRNWLEDKDSNMFDWVECECAVSGLDAWNKYEGAWYDSRRTAKQRIKDSGFVLGGDWKEFLDWTEDASVRVDGMELSDILKSDEAFDVQIRLFYCEQFPYTEELITIANEVAAAYM